MHTHGFIAQHEFFKFQKVPLFTQHQFFNQHEIFWLLSGFVLQGPPFSSFKCYSNTNEYNWIWHISRIHHKVIYINALCNLQGFFSFSTYTYYECLDLEVLLLKYAIDDIGMHFFYVLFPLALKSLAVIPILSKYWFSKQFPFDCQCVFMTRLKSVFLRSNKSESHEAALQLIRLAI